ncbi:unnamed protein product [Gadus morhua 'NCC']
MRWSILTSPSQVGSAVVNKPNVHVAGGGGGGERRGRERGESGEGRAGGFQNVCTLQWLSLSPSASHGSNDHLNIDISLYIIIYIHHTFSTYILVWPIPLVWGTGTSGPTVLLQLSSALSLSLLLFLFPSSFALLPPPPPPSSKRCRNGGRGWCYRGNHCGGREMRRGHHFFIGTLEKKGFLQ